MFSKPNTLLYLRRNSLIVAGKHITPARLTFPPEALQNLEIRNQKQFVGLCTAFFEENNIRHKRLLVVMDDSAVFKKKLELGKAANPEEILAEFSAAMPFAAGLRSCLGVSSGTELHIYATNAGLYTALETAIKACDAGKLVAVTPLAAYSLSADQPLSAAIDIFLGDSAVRSRANFLTVRPQ